MTMTTKIRKVFSVRVVRDFGYKDIDTDEWVGECDTHIDNDGRLIVVDLNGEALAIYERGTWLAYNFVFQAQSLDDGDKDGEDG